MSFGGSGGGNSSIAGSSDVTLSNPANQEYLGYDSDSSKWVNSSLTGKAALASGGGLENTYGQSVNATNATLDLANGNVFRLHVYGNPTFVFAGASSNAGQASAFSIYMTYQQAGSIITWPSNVKWSGGAAPVLTLAVDSTDILVFETPDGGSTWYGYVAGLDMR